MTSPPTGRGRGRGGRGRGRRPRKIAESAVRGELSQLATYSARAPMSTPQTLEASGPSIQARDETAQTPTVHSSTQYAPKLDSNTQHGPLMDGSAQGISAVSQATAVALIQKAIKETNLENTTDIDQTPSKEKTRHARLTPNVPSASTPDEVSQEPTPLITQPSRSLGERTLQADTPQASREDGLAVLSSSAISTQVFAAPPQQHTNYEFHMHTPNSISSSLQGTAPSSGRGRGRKRKGLTRPSGADAPPKRPRGRPKGSGNKLQPVEGAVKKRRGRKPKTFLPNTSHTMLQPLAPKETVPVRSVGVVTPPTAVDDSPSTSVISGEEPVNQTAKVSLIIRRLSKNCLMYISAN